MASATAVAVLLVLGSFLYWIQQGIKPVVTRLQNEQVVTAYLADSPNPQASQVIVDSIRLNLGSSAVAGAPPAEIHYVPATEFLAHLKSQYGELSRQLEELGAEENSIIPSYITVTGSLSPEEIDRLRSTPGIESVETSRDRYRHVVGAFAAVKWIVDLLMVGLAVALFTGLLHLSRMNGYLHRDALSLLKFWGASPQILRTPGLLSGLSVGFLGGALASAMGYALSLSLTTQVRSLAPVLKNIPTYASSLALMLTFIGAVLGLISGALAAPSFMGKK
jgi:cell division protein FtsX